MPFLPPDQVATLHSFHGASLERKSSHDFVGFPENLKAEQGITGTRVFG